VSAQIEQVLNSSLNWHFFSFKLELSTFQTRTENLKSFNQKSCSIRNRKSPKKAKRLLSSFKKRK
jgi:hypothetical protein